MNQKCPSCGRLADEKDNFCAACGARLKPALKGYFMNGYAVCILLLLFLGDYFAIFGFKYAKRAARAFESGDLPEAKRQRTFALRWAFWGLIPSSLINYYIMAAVFESFQSTLNSLARIQGL